MEAKRKHVVLLGSVKEEEEKKLRLSAGGQVSQIGENLRCLWDIRVEMIRRGVERWM